MPSAERGPATPQAAVLGLELPPEARTRLLEVAAASIDHGLAHGQPLPVDPLAHPAALREHRATFVTLHRAGALRGCVGALEPRRPLVEDAAYGAFNAAFRDPRFAPLRPDEREGLDIHLSILSPLSPIGASDEKELLAQLRPGIDGLVFTDGAAQATFLPAVWKSLPEPERFLAELRRKAGLAPDHWSASVEVLRYRVIDLP